MISTLDQGDDETDRKTNGKKVRNRKEAIKNGRRFPRPRACLRKKSNMKHQTRKEV